jgi:hypothetical protein
MPGRSYRHGKKTRSAFRMAAGKRVPANPRHVNRPDCPPAGPARCRDW